jgi:Fic family protein
VFVVNGKGDILHSGADYNEVPTLVSELFEWGKSSDTHPLIKSSAMHFMIEHIHPFRDGNGRIGRLWQTLVLTKWNALFEWMPVETIIYNNQAKYYEVLQRSHNKAGKVDCTLFIDFMLDVLENTMYKYIDTATTTIAIEDRLGTNDIVKLGVKLGVKLCVNQIKILKLIILNNYITIKEMAEKIKISETAIQNNLSKLKTAGIIVRIGSDKSGYWKIIEN